MKKLNNKTEGFTLVETLLVLLIVAVICFGGYYVYHNQHKTNNSTSTATKTTTTTSSQTSSNLYAGWKLYTLTNEQASFKYPSNWTLTNDNTGSSATTDSDQVEVKAPDGFDVTIAVTAGQLQDNGDTAALSSSKITFLGQSEYLVYTSGLDANANPVGTISGVN